MRYRFLSLFLLSISYSSFADEGCDTNWLMGTWESQSAKRTYTESWQRISANTAEGRSEVRDQNNNVIGKESLRLLNMGGNTFYLAKVKANAMPIPFKLVECTQNQMKFENIHHDFPKSLTYQLEGKSRLFVQVRGDGDDGFDLSFNRLEPNN